MRERKISGNKLSDHISKISHNMKNLKEKIDRQEQYS